MANLNKLLDMFFYKVADVEGVGFVLFLLVSRWSIRQRRTLLIPLLRARNQQQHWARLLPGNSLVTTDTPI